MPDPSRPPDAERPARDRIPPVEWVLGAVGALLLVAILAFLVREAARGPGRPPDVVVAVDTVVAGRGGWLVRVRAANLGDESAAAVTLRGTLARRDGGGEPLVREAQLDYLPGHSERRAGLVFPVDPRAGTLVVEVVGHQAP